MKLERNDLIAIGIALLIPLVAGIFWKSAASPKKLVQISIFTGAAATVSALLSVVGIYLGRKSYGGEVARNLEIIGIGFLLWAITFVPHIFWHIAGLPNPLGPGWGPILSKAWWTGFFHIGALAFFLISTYGFYLFWEGGK